MVGDAGSFSPLQPCHSFCHWRVGCRVAEYPRALGVLLQNWWVYMVLFDKQGLSHIYDVLTACHVSCRLESQTYDHITSGYVSTYHSFSGSIELFAKPPGGAVDYFKPGLFPQTMAFVLQASGESYNWALSIHVSQSTAQELLFRSPQNQLFFLFSY